ncbi:toxin [Pseudomonas sp. GL93]|uniref:Tc toxin subunit A n=1 Tax=Pseudomonas sp. GL93 TaxID=2014741 RepID=UPI000E31A7D9|nr:Tc toxin subunit A [Pseudomonas sp. GL93]RFD23925.1 toxin [Pseudomonas sp. GL93]
MDAHSPTYTHLFKEDWHLLCSASSMAAIDSPVAYLKALYLFAQALEKSGRGKQPKVTLDQRRPELKTLPLDERSLSTVIPQLSMINETLSSLIDAHLKETRHEDRGRSLDEVLGKQRFPFVLPFERAHRQCWLGLSGGKPQLGELSYRISLKLPTSQRAQNTYGVVRHEAYEAQRLLSGLSPAQQMLLTEPFVQRPESLQAKDFFTRHYGTQEPLLEELSHWSQMTGLTSDQTEALLACGKYVPALSNNVLPSALPTTPTKLSLHNGAAYVNGPVTTATETQTPLSIAPKDKRGAHLQNTSWDRYQRLHRMIRLQRWTQLPFDELDTLLMAVMRREPDGDPAQPANDNTLRALGVYRYLERRRGLSLQAFAAMLNEIPVWAPGIRLSLYDELFNPGPLPGQALTLDTLTLVLNEEIPATLRHQLCAGLHLSDTPDSLHWLIKQARLHLPPSCPTLTFYSALYRQARIAQLFGLSVLDSYHVAALLGDKVYTAQLVNPSLRRSGANAPADLLDVLMQMDWLVTWLNDTGQTVDQLRRQLLLDAQSPPPQVQTHITQLNDVIELTRHGLLVQEDLADLSLPQPEPDTKVAPVAWHALLVQGLLRSNPQLKPAPPKELPNGLVQLIEAQTLSLDPDRNAVLHNDAKQAVAKKLGAFYQQMRPLKEKIDTLLGVPSHLAGDPATHLQWRKLMVRQIARTATAESTTELLKNVLLSLPGAEVSLGLAVSREALQAFVLHPHWLSPDHAAASLLKLTLNTLYLLQRFAHCLNTYGLAQDSVLAYLQCANSSSDEGSTVTDDGACTAQLAALLQWDADEIGLLVEYLPAKQVKTLADLDWLLRCHEAVRLTGLSARALLKATDLHATLMNEDWQHVGSALFAAAP